MTAISKPSFFSLWHPARSRRLLVFGAITFGASRLAFGAVDTKRPHVVNGEVVQGCGWPTVVHLETCAGALVHPQAIAIARTCNLAAGQAVHLGNGAPWAFSTETETCVYDKSQGAAICKLKDAIIGVPITPIAFACEVAKYVVKGTAVVYAGFGETAPMADDGGVKRWANATIEEVFPDHTVIAGLPNDSTSIPSLCPGDLGSPVFVRADDGGFRVFGAARPDTSETPCGGAIEFERVDTMASVFEALTGLDITPCFVGVTGQWSGGPDCSGFWAGDETGPGDWSDLCSGTTVSGPANACAGGAGGTGGLAGTGGATGGRGGSAGAGGAAGTPVIDDLCYECGVKTSCCGPSVPATEDPNATRFKTLALGAVALAAGLRRRRR